MPTRSRAAGLVSLLLILAACSGAEHILGPTTYDVSGRWFFEETLSDTALDVFCNDYGMVTVTQDGPRFTVVGHQTGGCEGPGGFQPFDSIPLTIDDGTIDQNTIHFHIDVCPYAGTTHGTKPDSLTGTIDCRLLVEGTRVRLRGTWHIIPNPDRAPPTVAGTRFGGGTNGRLEAGDDTLYVRVVAADNFAIRTVGYELRSGPLNDFARRDSLLFTANDLTSVDDTLIFPLPLNYAYQGPTAQGIYATVFARDTANHLATAPLDSFVVYGPPPPTVRGTVTGATSADSVGALKDTLVISVTGEAARALTYIGYRLASFVLPGDNAPGDSVAVTATIASHEFRVPVPLEWKGRLIPVQIFVRDRLGLQGSQLLGEWRVVVYPSRPTVTFRVSQGVSDIVYDAKRDRVFVMTALDSTPQAGHPEVRIFDVGTPAAEPGILVSWFADGLDLSPGNDSLLLTLYSGRLGIINLNTLTQDSTDVIAFPASNGRYPWKVRAMANGKAIISIASAYWGALDPGKLVEFDLTTGAQTLRTDVGAAGDIGLNGLLARTPDRAHLLLHPADPTVSKAQLYQSATNSFSPAVATPAAPIGNTSISSDATGSLWLVGNVLLDANLTTLRQFAIGGPGASVLSYDGVYTYVSIDEGVAKLRTSDGTLVERILLQSSPYKLSITPDGNTLIAVGFGLQLIDLR